MTITGVCKKSKIVWLFLSSALLLAACGERQATKSATVEAQQTAGKIRQVWATACRPLTITLEGMEAGLPGIGVYMHLTDATDTERNAFYGVPFIYDNGRYVAQEHHTVTADTLAAIYACFPYRQGLAADDSLVLAAPFGENLYGVETARHTGKEISVEMDWHSSMVLLGIGCESDRLQERLDGLALTGENLYEQAVYQPYLGKWRPVGKGGTLNATDADCLLNNGRKHDFYLVPTDTEGAVTIAATIDGHPYAVRTTLPPMQAGSLVRLNLRKGKEGLAVNGSWVETRRKLRYQPVQRVDSVEVGHYLQKDGRICPQRDSNSIAMVVETDGRHGKAVALRDSEGRYCYSGKVLTSGKTFQTIDGKRKEGVINPRQTDEIVDENKLIFTSGMPYGEQCAFGYADGADLTQRLIDKYRQTEHAYRRNGGLLARKEMLAEVEQHPGSYVPSLAELAQLYHHRQLGETVGCEPMRGEYLTVSESSDKTFYLIDMENGIVTGTLSKQYASLRLRLFYLF
ncbi:hypothetical protein [Bacteroides caccae]|uniref:hypothetical protein n=1 Tax=Bacteroides caccae TaxID=47678 RepID=UPI003569BBDA